FSSRVIPSPSITNIRTAEAPIEPAVQPHREGNARSSPICDLFPCTRRTTRRSREFSRREGTGCMRRFARRVQRRSRAFPHSDLGRKRPATAREENGCSRTNRIRRADPYHPEVRERDRRQRKLREPRHDPKRIRVYGRRNSASTSVSRCFPEVRTNRSTTPPRHVENGRRTKRRIRLGITE